MNSNINKNEIIIESLNETEKAEMQMKFINKYKDIFELLEKCHVINHTELTFFADLSERTARRFTNNYLDRRVVKINNKITVLNKDNEHYLKALTKDEIYKELIEKLPRRKATLLRLKNRAFYILNSDNRELKISTKKLDNSLARAIEYKLRKESDLDEFVEMKDFINKYIRETINESDKNTGILDENNKIIATENLYKLVQGGLLRQGYDPNVFFEKIILKKLEIIDNTTVAHINYIFKDYSDGQIGRDIEILLATFELLIFKDYKNMSTRNLKFNLQIYSTTSLNVAHIEKTIKHSRRTMNFNYQTIEDQVLQEVNNKPKEGGKMYLFYTKLFNQDNKYFIYDEKNKCFKLYY